MDNPTRLVAAAVDVFNRVGNLDQTISMIEAAPDLLEALQEFHDYMCIGYEVGENETLDSLLDQAEAAIAKTQ